MNNPTDTSSEIRTSGDLGGIHAEYQRLTQDLRARVWAYLEPLGINRVCFSYLLFIDGHKGCKVSEIVDAMHMDKASVTRSLSTLGKLGYVDRQVGKMETRTFVLYLTPAGKAIVKGVAGIAQDWERDLMAAMSEEEYTATLSALRRAREHFIQSRAKNAMESVMRGGAGMSFFY